MILFKVLGSLTDLAIYMTRNRLMIGYWISKKRRWF